MVALPSVPTCGGSFRWFGKNIPISDAPDWLIYELLKAEKQTIVTAAASVPVGKAIAFDEKVLEDNRHTELSNISVALVNTSIRRLFLKEHGKGMLRLLDLHSLKHM